jgi:O-succinylbenzoic acid--CoA ligase
VTFRPLHAVLVPQGQAGGRLLDAVGAALDGTGPAILPLDPALPRARLDELIEAFAPTTIGTASGPQRLRPAAPAGQAAPGVEEQVAVVLATSGSTGQPKAAELTAPAMLAAARASLSRLGAAAGERWLCCLPTHHVSGLGVLVRSLVAGSSPVVAERLDRAALADAAAAGARYVSLVPTQLRRLLDARAPVAAFRAILLGGAAIPPGMLDEAAATGATVVTTYGMTETCGGCVYNGVPLTDVRVAQGPDGRIRISGPVLFSRYRLAPELTAAALDDGWFVTADLGGPGPDGKLILRGRADDVINSGGEKVIADEVEQALRACPGVRDAVVVGVPDSDWGERVTAMVIAAEPADPPTLAGLRQCVRDQLPRHAAPQGLVIVTEIPMLASGKPDRQEVRRIACKA